MSKNVVEFQCYDLASDSEGNIGVILPDPLHLTSWSFWWGEDSWNQINWAGGLPWNGIRCPIVKVFRASGHSQRVGIACSLGYDNRTRSTEINDLDLIWEKPNPLKLGTYEATVTSDGKLKVGCQTITYQQAKAAFEALEAVQVSSPEPDWNKGVPRSEPVKFELGDVVTYVPWNETGRISVNSAINNVGEEVILTQCVGTSNKKWIEPHWYVSTGWTIPESAMTLVRRHDA
jgi:hypothetical protein